MKLQLKRIAKKDKYTIGKLYINGEYFCETLEDTDRGLSQDMPLSKIKEIKQNIKDFVSSQIQISEHSNRMLSAGVGMHPALGGAGESGRSDSGSEQLYALKNYLITGIDIPEAIVTKAINYALKVNFPEKDLKIGFYHLAPEKEEDVTPSKRIKNQV